MHLSQCVSMTIVLSSRSISPLKHIFLYNRFFHKLIFLEMSDPDEELLFLRKIGRKCIKKAFVPFHPNDLIQQYDMFKAYMSLHPNELIQQYDMFHLHYQISNIKSLSVGNRHKLGQISSSIITSILFLAQKSPLKLQT